LSRICDRLVMRRHTVLVLAVLVIAAGLHLTDAGGRRAAAKVVLGGGSALSPQSLQIVGTFGGRVYEGDVGDERYPLAGVTVELYGGNDSYPEPGVWLRSTTTNDEGWYGLDVYDDDVFEFYHIRETNPRGFSSVGAMSVDGTVRTDDWIEYVIPLEGKTLSGNKFWDQALATETPTATSTGTRTATPTHTRVTDTPSPTPTPTGTLPPGCVELLENGDFESGSLLPWSRWGDVHLAGWGYESAHGAALGGVDDAEGELFQGVTIPAGAHPVRLEFWWIVEFEAEQPGDFIDVLVQYGEEFDTMRVLRAVEPVGVWRHEVVDLGAYAGQTILVTFLVRTDGEMPSAFVLDEISLQACGVPTPTSTPTRTIGPPPDELPDLVVTDVWNEGHLICCQVMNIGIAAAPAGSHTALFVDGVHVASGPVDITLEAGQRWRGCFDYRWECTPRQDAIMVWADHEDQIVEQDEANNGREETWRCDTTPPEIISGPTASEITVNSAVISWETNENSDSVVQYGKFSRSYESQEADATLTTVHQVGIIDLEASTTYRFSVQSSDASGNAVESAAATFRTSPAPDYANPSVWITDTGTWEGTVIVAAQATDNTGVEKVEFFLDDRLILTDYTAPYLVPVDSTQYANGDHSLKAKVHDASRRSAESTLPVSVNNLVDSTWPQVSIAYPRLDQSVSGKITVTAYLTDDVGLDSARFYVDQDQKQYEPLWATAPTSAKVEFSWDTRKLTHGRHDIAVQARDTSAQDSYDLVRVTVVAEPPPPPPVYPDLRVLSHRVSRTKNRFAITLTVKNEGNAEARNIWIRDELAAFQAISSTDSLATYRPDYDPVGMSGYCEIIPKAAIPAGASRVFSFNAIPAMIYAKPPTTAPSPDIGDVIYLEWRSAAGSPYHETDHNKKIGKTEGGEALSHAHKMALKQADYLIVTNPYRLFALYNPTYYSGPSQQRRDVNAVPSAMAELAYYKSGALGYLHENSKETLRDLLAEKGKWSSRLKSGWTSSGYLLIVGETQIVPAWKTYHEYSVWPFYSQKRIVRSTDLQYANTVGSYYFPELCVGRIIGNSANQLRRLIETSIRIHLGEPGYKLDRSHALVVSGDGDGVGKFEASVDEVAGILDDQFSVKKLKVTEVQASGKKMLAEFKANVKDRDVIYFRDHGVWHQWCDVISTGDFNPPKPTPTVDFGNTKPFAFACCCYAGQYHNMTGIAERFLGNGASIYIGSTEKSKRDANNYAAKKFFNYWVNTSRSIGLALKETKRDIAEKKWGLVFVTNWDNYVRRLWVSEYQLYGDPKLGGSTSGSSTLATLATAALQGPLPALDVTIPDYYVTTIEGQDYAEIPGGDVLLELGKPVVPGYNFSVDYPEGYKVQDVRLTSRSGLVTATDLNIPNAADEWDEASIRSYTGEGDGWWPEDAFTWSVVENPDGCTTLVISIAPFFYNAQTTDVRFYQDYHFDIDYALSGVAITALSSDKAAYAQGEPVTVDIELENTGGSQDIVAHAVIERPGTAEPVASLLLETLTDMQGRASFSPQWDSTGFEPEDYDVKVTLKDSGGTLLDQRTTTFHLGICLGEITEFSATPAYFHIGDTIHTSLNFRNAGTEVISGTAVIQVQNEQGGVVQDFRHDIADLDMGASVRFDDAWDTSGLEEGTWAIIGYVLYDGMATDPRTALVSTSPPQERLYLPAICKRFR